MNDEEKYVQIDLLNLDEAEDWFFDEDIHPSENKINITNRERYDLEEDRKKEGGNALMQNIVRILVMVVFAYIVVRFILGAWIALFIFLAISAFFISLYLNPSE